MTNTGMTGRPTLLPLGAVWLIVASALGLYGATSVQAQPARDIARKAFPSVVLLVMEDAKGQPLSLGSGFVVRTGLVATNLHVIEGAARGYAKFVGQKTKHDLSGIVGIDDLRDLILLAVPSATNPVLPLGDTGQVAVGDEVYAVGNPLGFEGALPPFQPADFSGDPSPSPLPPRN